MAVSCWIDNKIDNPKNNNVTTIFSILSNVTMETSSAVLVIAKETTAEVAVCIRKSAMMMTQ